MAGILEENGWSKDSGMMRRSALGRVANIGDFYDARTETFHSKLVVQKNIPDDAILQQVINKSEIHYSESDQLSDRFQLLNIEAELQLPILFGMLKIAGSGRYLTEETKSEKTVSCSLLYNILTVSEKWVVTSDAKKFQIDFDAVSDENCTHVVVQTNWGANCIVSLENQFSDSSCKTEAMEFIKGALKNLAGLIEYKNQGQGQYEDIEKGKGKNFRLEVFSDILPQEKVPTTVEDVIEFMLRIPDLVNSLNGGKGRRLTYTMMPLSMFRKLCYFEQPDKTILKAIDESFVIGVIIFFEELVLVKQKLNDLMFDFNKHQKYVPGDVLSNLRNLLKDLYVKETYLKMELSGNLVKVRSGQQEMRQLIKCFEKRKASEINLVMIQDSVDSFSAVQNKLDFVRNCLLYNAAYITKNENFDDILMQNDELETFALFICEDFKKKDAELFRNTINFFLRMSKDTQPDKKFLVVDLDLVGKSNISDKYWSKIRVCHYKGSSLISHDVFKDFEKEAILNMAKPTNQELLENVHYKPIKRTFLELFCPGSFFSNCSKETLKWSCHRCKDHLEYGFDDYFYCSCGKGLVHFFKFRCSNPDHGSAFASFPMDCPITNELQKLRPLKELNILILGQSGVGKSTWINSIVNYLQYDTLEEAQKGGVICVIPASFSVTYNATDRQLVQIGNGDSNENQNVGTSSTRGPKTYHFLLADRSVRLIDTPGLGDSSGIDQDKKNVRKILDHISHLKEIHGICILMKSNDTVISAIFKFCIKELLTHLHKDAAHNILFCFTNSRSSFYSPGDTSDILGRLLEESNLNDMIGLSHNTMFCLDNEAFRFLCTLKYENIKHREKDVNSFKDSWEISVEETKRIFEQIKCLEPHAVRHTMTLCSARNRILNLTKPIAEITQTIQLNIAAIADEERKIIRSTETLEELAQKLYLPQIELVPEKLDKPRTVCTNSSCVTYYKLQNVDVTQIEYNTLCHVDCQLKNITPEIYPNPDLLYCWAMTGDNKPNCCNCDCSWDKHMHFRYSQKRVEKNVIDSNVEKEMNDKNTAKSKVEQHLYNLQKTTRDLEEEQEIITNITSRFAVFLKENAIAPYNDGFKEYLKYLIRLEKDKIRRTEADDDLLTGLQMMMIRYEEEVKFLECSMTTATCKGHLTPEDIVDLEQKLYSLPLNGDQIKQNAKMSEQLNKKGREYFEFPLPIRNRLGRFSHTKEDSNKILPSVTRFFGLWKGKY